MTILRRLYTNGFEAAAPITDAILSNGLAAMRREKPRGAERRVLVIGAARWGSLGDEAMHRVLLSEIGTTLPDAKTVTLAYNAQDRLALNTIGAKSVDASSLFRFVPSPLGLTRLSAELDRASDLVVIGADVMDGRYGESRVLRKLALCGEAVARGRHAAIVGFSFSDRATSRVIEGFRRLPAKVRLVCRDPVSANRLAHATGHSPINGADLGFLMPPAQCPSPDIAAALRQIDAWQTAGQRVIAVNANPLGLLLADPSLNLRSAAKKLSATLDRLAEITGAAFVLIPHEFRPQASDVPLLRQVQEGLSKKTVHLALFEPFSAPEAKTVCVQCDLAITGRMHLGIACLGGGVPAVMLDYQGKIEGLAQLVGAPELVFDVRAFADSVNEASNRLAALLRRSGELRALITSRLPEIRRMARRNVEVLL